MGLVGTKALKHQVEVRWGMQPILTPPIIAIIVRVISNSHLADVVAKQLNSIGHGTLELTYRWSAHSARIIQRIMHTYTQKSECSSHNSENRVWHATQWAISKRKKGMKLREIMKVERQRARSHHKRHSHWSKVHMTVLNISPLHDRKWAPHRFYGVGVEGIFAGAHAALHTVSVCET